MAYTSAKTIHLLYSCWQLSCGALNTLTSTVREATCMGLEQGGDAFLQIRLSLFNAWETRARIQTWLTNAAAALLLHKRQVDMWDLQGPQSYPKPWISEGDLPTEQSLEHAVLGWTEAPPASTARSGKIRKDMAQLWWMENRCCRWKIWLVSWPHFSGCGYTIHQIQW